jgi:intraflagellar transport protein 88
MTSNRGAGYDPRAAGTNFDPMGKAKGAVIKEKTEMSIDAKLKDEEKKILRMVEDCAILRSSGRMSEALDKAKDASRREKQLGKLREQHGSEINHDLAGSVCLNLASIHHASGNFTEALTLYNHVVKSKTMPMVGRLRVNMGNIYYEQGKFPTAIKMYRMALDQVPATHASLRNRIYRSIGHAFCQMHQFHDALERLRCVCTNIPPSAMRAP